ncbi:MAG: aryl-sulfate sulfotransferase, partial [Candidatus Thorarchaeota archaeon]
MRSFKILAVFLVALFVVSLVVPANNSSYIPARVVEGHDWLSVDLPTNSTYLAEYELAKNVRVYDETQVTNGWNLFQITIYPNYTQNTQLGFLFLTDMNGDIVNGFYMDSSRAVSPKFINSTTVAYGDRSIRNITLWNVFTNTTEVLPVPQGHHEFEYNPVSDTFLIMDGLDLVEFNFTGELMPATGDDIVEYDREGNELWRWECNDTFPFDPAEFYLRNESRRGELDWMHSNSLYWDVDNGEIYMSVRHLDSVVKVDYDTAQTAWV